MTSLKCVAVAALLLMASVAQAQYVWIDAKGIKQISDIAPPASVPLDKILKSPRSMGNPDSAAAAPLAPTSTAKGETSIAEREADYRKRMADKAVKDKDAADKAAIASQRSAACNAARAAQAQLADGRRIRNADGSFVDDAQRAQQNARANAILQDCAQTGS